MLLEDVARAAVPELVFGLCIVFMEIFSGSMFAGSGVDNLKLIDRFSWGMVTDDSYP